MARETVVILLLGVGCFVLATAKNANNKTKFLASNRDVDLSTIDTGLQPPPYMNSLLNQLLDLRGGGHGSYLNVYPSSWTTNQVNNELTVDVQFSALYNSQTTRCSAHIIASMPPDNNPIPTIVPVGSTIQCSPSSGGTPSFARVNPGPVSNGYGGPAFTPGAYVPHSAPYNTIPNYYVPRGPQLVYRTKYVPITVPTLVPPAPQPNPYAGSFVPAGPVSSPTYMVPRGIGVPINEVMPFGPNYLY